MKLFFVLALAAINAVRSAHLPNENLQIAGRIAGGQSAAKGQFPYIVLIETHFDASYKFCGGAFVGVNWILSAASCFYEMKYANVYLGVVEIQDADVSYNVKPWQVFAHPLWTHSSHKHDIAIVGTPRTSLCLNIFPVPLPHLGGFPIPTFEGYFAFATGWGGIRDDMVMETLQYARLEIISNAACAFIRDDLNGNEICAAVNPGVASTQIDIGGPLVTEDGLLVGLMPHCQSNSCVSSDSVLVFTRVSNYLTWIMSVMRTRGRDQSQNST